MTEFVTTQYGDRVAFDRYEGAGDPAARHEPADTQNGASDTAAGPATERAPGDNAVGRAPVVVFVRGVGPTRAFDGDTRQTAEALAAAGVTAIVYDRVGRGESAVPEGDGDGNADGEGGDAPSGPITLQRELAAIDALITTAGGGAVLCGHSSGCTIALAAASAGLPVTGLVLWEAPLGGITGGTQAWADEIARRVASGDREGALVHYMKDMPPEWLDGARRSPMFAGMVAQVGSQVPDAESLAWADSAPLPELVGGLAIPVEAVYGEQTQPIMVTAAQAIAAAIPGATAKRMPGANHSWQPAAMAAALAALARAARP
ncbi:alpha/beta hydrolase [Subtercola sp. Z020]|uniref:alpha/beta hydrolase n=1 Tax=Subtercola sp. Z020 TaxID=2080582 RepID=UPI000CE89F36|nr:alpha/beta hydrolase [Subtercola sp. Z020]PPF80276.1 alpha/beta hydrolase [Subtercola sp. Z020]